MPLDEYRRKRDFTKSPEPPGEADRSRRAATPKPLFFCVQKHLASHLHYDFRLDHEGVLLSWAVPKGPSLDPAVKRLAMHVEDHPLEYGTFEGVIPEGYGAGIVMLWDTGTWIPEVADVPAALAKGDLKLRLDGYKLKGSWALVRTRGYGKGASDGRSWLLIKHRDEWAGDVDITSFAPLSVKSERDFPEILAADNPDIWKTNRPASGGETGAMLRDIIERAAALKAGRPLPPAAAPATRRAAPEPRRPARAATGTRPPAARKTAPPSKGSAAQSRGAKRRSVKAASARTPAARPKSRRPR
jgi:bifunctional non-homologous end joining protein LigD